MQIGSLTVTAFKAVTEPVTYRFHHGNVIYGTNETGKTTLVEAICFCLYGCNLAGSNRYLEPLYNRDAMQEYKALPAGLESRFEEWCRGKEGAYLDLLVGFRAKHGLYVPEPCLDVAVTLGEDVIHRKRILKGTKSITTVTNKTGITFMDLAERLPDKDLFFSVFVAGHFFGLDQGEQRKLFERHIPEVDWREMVGTNVWAEITDIDCPNLNSVIAATKSTWSKKSQDVADLKTRAASLQRDTRPVDGISVLPMVEALRQDIQATDREVVSHRARYGKHIEAAATNRRLSELNEVLTGEIAEAEQHNIGIKHRRAAAKAESEATNEEWKSPPKDESDSLMSKAAAVPIPVLELPDEPLTQDIGLQTTPILHGISKCPECGADLEAYVKKQTTTAIGVNVERKQQAVAQLRERYTAWEEACRTAQCLHDEKYSDLTEVRYNLLKEAEAASDLYVAQLVDWESSRQALARLDQEMNLPLQNVPKLHELMVVSGNLGGISVEEAEARLADAENRLSALRIALDQDLVALGKEEAYREAAVAARRELDTLPAQLDKAERKLVKAADAKEEASRLRGTVLARRMAPVMALAKDVEVSLFREVKKTGVLVSDMLFSRDGVPYSVLSNSAQVKMGIAVSVLLNRLSRADIPLFVDNAEAVVSLPSVVKEQQYFISYVHRQHTELKVEVA